MQISKELYEFFEEEKQMLQDNIDDCQYRISRSRGSRAINEKNIALYQRLIAELNELSPTIVVPSTKLKK